MNTVEYTISEVAEKNFMLGLGELKPKMKIARSGKLYLSRVLKRAENKLKPLESLLVQEIALGNQSALAELYDRYSKPVFALVFKIVRNREESEELVQAIFIKVWNKASGFNQSKGNVFSWLMAISRNCAIDWIRSSQFKRYNRNYVAIEDAELTDTDNISQSDSAQIFERAELVSEALKSIRDEEREVIYLAFYSGLTQSEIASYLKIPLGTVKTRIRQALIKLEKVLAETI